MRGRRIGAGRPAGPEGGEEARPPAIRRWRDAAVEGLAAATGGDRDSYDRARLLPRLIAIDARELSASDPELDHMIRARLTRALRAERRRGRAGHWTYDLDRHVALLQALAAEGGAGDPRTAEPETKRRRPDGPDGA